MKPKRNTTPAAPRGPGRPVAPGIDRRTSRTISLPDSLWQRLTSESQSRGLTLSAFIQTIIEGE